ncbi:thioesterase [Bacillus aquiflavi]|uniref:Thioesterase n=1 Tax=Bacillus aquiflavi TaxID=2672567 RepID=A0A6B3W5J8_9BACI|nr:alpha/beta fold hydrolase [Bacillus aquiflavi]MBA4537129.1 thioesterase [Bacillus aquiflavi]NEY82714.1 thioesterase [Bacillus aquiflavi]
MQKVRLFCLPYAGGSSFIFSRWKTYLHPAIEIIPLELAGRGRRINEPLISNFEEMVNDIFKTIKNDLSDLPYIILGHSMGGLLAYELAYRILQSNSKMPILIILSGIEPPKLRKRKVISTLPDEEFVKEVLSIGGTPKNIFANKEASDIFISILRADFKLVESYVAQDYKPLDVDLMIFNGERDYSTTFPRVKEWKKYTNKSCQMINFEGGHFFIHDHKKEVINAINLYIEKVLY